MLADKIAAAAGFNSATALKPWMTAGRPVVAFGNVLLQFGHGVEAVDDSWKP